METQAKDIVIQLTDAILKAANSGKKQQAQDKINTLNQILNIYPYVLWNSIEVWKLAKVSLIMYHYDSIEDETLSIKTLEMAYAFAYRTQHLYETTLQQNNEEHYYNAIQTQILLLETCKDIYTYSIADLYAQSGKLSSQEMPIARGLAREIIPLLTYAFLDKIQTTFDGFKNNSFLEDLCNQIELEVKDLSEERINKALKINRLYLASIVKK